MESILYADDGAVKAILIAFTPKYFYNYLYNRVAENGIKE